MKNHGARSQAAVVPQPLSSFDPEKQRINIHCDQLKCSYSAVHTIPSLIERLGKDATLQDIMRRTYCPKCGKKPSGLRVVHYSDFSLRDHHT